MSSKFYLAEESMKNKLNLRFMSRLFSLLVIACLLLQVTVIAQSAQASPAFQAPNGLLQFPVCGTWQISGDYATHQANALYPQWSNYALDFEVPLNTPVYAAHDGIIIANQTGSGGSNDIVIRTFDGQYASIYSHLSSWVYPDGTVAAEGALVNRSVTAGDLIGLSGISGAAAYHLHFAFGATYGTGIWQWNSIPPEPMSGQTGFARYQNVTRNCSADSATYVGQSAYPTVMAGNQFSIYFDLINSGTTTWTPDNYWLGAVGDSLGASAQQPITTSVAPGQTYRFTIPMTAPATTGVYRTQWTMTKNGTGIGPSYMYIDVTVISASAVTISGNAGIAGTTLSYTDGSAKTVTADDSSNYTLTVPSNWSGAVTPSKSGYVFMPPNLSYSNVTTDQTAQNYAGVQDEGSLTFGVTYTQTPAGIPQRWKLTASSTNQPLLFDVRPVSDNLTYQLLLKDANGNVLVNTHSSVDGRGIITWENVTTGDYYVYIIPDPNSTGTYSITAWANSIPMIRFDWGEQTSYSNIRRWQSPLGVTPVSFYVAFNRTAGNIEITWSLKRRSDGAVLSSGNSTNGHAIAIGYASGYVDFYIDSASGDGSYRIGIFQGSPVLSFTNCASQSEIPTTECDALVALYNSTNGANWTNHTDWLQTNTPCSWYGVTCDGGHTTSLSLTENELAGTIPSEIENLAYLSLLDLSHNQLTGAILTKLCSLTNLTWINLDGNQLSGSIPVQLSNLENLTYLTLRDNKLTGQIPAQMGSLANLTELSLGGNQLTGTIPTELGSLTNLTELGLYRNQLTGTIPSQLGNLTNLIGLYLWSNQLTGPIPTELANLVNLQHIALGGNQLSGSIPSVLGGLSQLSSLQIQSNHFSGSIPSSLGNLTNLHSLFLNGNQLIGEIPIELGRLINLSRLDLSRNQLSGSIPAELGSLTNLTVLGLSENRLTGSIPAGLGSLTQLQYLYLNGNQLSGDFPTSIVNLTNLNSFGFDQCAGLTSSNPDVIAFLNQKAPNWNVCDQDMSVRRVGNAIAIPNGDTTPSFAEGTDLGGVGVDKMKLFDFRIWNNGSATPLQLTGSPIVTISGDPAFTVHYQPYSRVWPGSSSWFQIRFSPDSIGLHTATVSIANNDADKNPYTFTIHGVGSRSDAYENDDDFASARSITPGASQNHSIFPMGDADYTKFTLAAPSSIVLETSGVDGYDTEIALYDASHKLIGYDNDSGSFLYSRLERTCQNSLPAGTYYLRTYVYEGVIPQYKLALSASSCPTISGKVGVGGATLKYTDGTPKTVTADGGGNYSFTVSYNWTGTVTPSKTGYTFSPANKSYVNVRANQTAQNYTAITNPIVTSIIRASVNPSSAASVNFTVTFSKAVTGVDAADFSLTLTGIKGAKVTAVSGTGATRTVTVSTGSGSGTLRLNVIDNDTIRDAAGNKLGGAGLGNGNYTAGQSYIIDKTAPKVISSVRVNPSTTNLASVKFTVKFSEVVTGVDAADFSLTLTGIKGARITAVSGTGAIRTVTVSTGTGNGTLRLNVIDNDTIRDAARNKLGGTGLRNGNYMTGQSYTIRKR
jgi:Leucine-rich repeat (LRR) protein